MTFARNLEAISFTPWLATDNGSIFAIQQVFDTLLEYEPGQDEAPQPALARSWEVSDDGLSYTFELRPGVKFSNGDLLTAEDVKYSLDHFKDPKINPVWASLTEPLDKVTVVDPDHVRVDLEKHAALLDILCLPSAGIVNKAVIEKLGDKEYGRKPVATGPFTVGTWRKGEAITLERNPHFWRSGQPYLDKVIYRYVPSDSTRMLEVQSGQSDVADVVPYSQLKQLENTGGVTVEEKKVYSTMWILINTTKKPLNDVKVRQALAYAMPWEQIRDVVFQGKADIANSANLPTKYLDRSIPPYSYDLDKAKALLADSSAPNGLRINYQITSGDTVGEQLATILQESWKKIGVDVDIQKFDVGTLNANHENFNYDLVNTGPNSQTSDISVDDEFDVIVTNEDPSDWPFTGWYSKEAARAVDRAVHGKNEEVRKTEFSNYQQILHDEVPIIGVVYPPNLFLVRDNVKDFETVPEAWPVLRLAWLEP